MSSIRQAEAAQESSDWVIAPFWQRLNNFFLFPLQRTPLFYAVGLALCSYALLLGSPWDLMVGLGLMLSVSRYAFKVAALASRGVINSADYRPDLVDEAWKWLPWKFFAILMVFAVFINFFTKLSLELGWVARLLVSMLIPAALMVLINTCRLRSAINPFELIATVSGVGKSYWLLCFFLFLLQQGSPLSMDLLLSVAPEELVLPLMAFVVIYFTWVMAAMIGYVMYQHHAELDIDPLQAPEASVDMESAEPAVVEAKRRDALVARLVQEGNMDEAIALAREWQRVSPDSIKDQRRYFRVLKLTDQQDTLLAQAQQFIPLLLAGQRAGEALEVWSSCTKRVPSFRLASAQVTYDVAQQAWKVGKAKYVLMILRSFEKQFPNSELTPLALELMVRAFKQGLNRPVQAVRVYLHMKDLYSDHPSTKEAEWLLRDELEKVSLKL